MRKYTLLLMICTLLSKLLGFVRELTISYFYGASPISDAYFIAMGMPGIILEFLAVGLITAYIPMVSRLDKDDSGENISHYTNNLLNIIFVFTVIIFILAEMFAPFLVKLFAAGFKGEVYRITLKYSRIALLGLFIMGSQSIYVGYLQLKENYLVPALAGIPLNIITIGSIILSAKTNDLILIIGSVIAVYSQIVIVFLASRKLGFQRKWVFDIKDPYIRSTLLIALPVIIGTTVNQVNVLIDKTLASTIVIGGVSALNYAYKLNVFIQGIFVLSLSAVIFPILSKMSKDRNVEGLKGVLAESFSFINLLLFPLTIGALIFSKEIVAVLFGRGAFDENALLLTSSALFFYSIGMIGFGYREVLSKAFYSMHDTKTPVVNATIGVGINIVLNLVLSRFMGLGGLALATSISALVTAALMMGSLRKKLGKLDIWSIDVAKILLASVVMGGCAKMTFDLLSVGGGMFSSLVLAVLCGVVVYVILGLLLKIEEAVKLKNIVVARLKR